MPIRRDRSMQNWKELFKRKKAELLKSKETTAQMPDYIPFAFYEGDLQAGVISSKAGTMIPYQKPEVVDEFVHHKKQNAIVIIKTQIDYHICRGMQFAWSGYFINSKLVAKQRYYETAYMIEIKEEKDINYDAIELWKASNNN